jgi:hypothetical protein
LFEAAKAQAQCLFSISVGCYDLLITRYDSHARGSFREGQWVGWRASARYDSLQNFERGIRAAIL